ncbi:hypothetical protein EDB95_4492 [Dinghuibacter silviterrae]|uniref:Uncharacterized protein n=2 Tax=Dinghuibacter silviterrae TaxID=1539049 RepID=A0A4R8DGR5_9BACT|nr:hypothetical protein EDB95_4492 [Dinghuibacter silviterrae]
MGIVYKKWHTSGRNRHEWLLKCRFYVNGVEYSTFSEEDKYNQYKIGDTLHVVYAERTPTNCEILELK